MIKLGWVAAILLIVAGPAWAGLDAESVERIIAGHRLSEPQAARARNLLTNLPFLTQGVAPATNHPVSRDQCMAEVLAAGKLYRPPAGVCGGRPFMVPLGTGACIDQFEFPGLPCDYPVTWAKGSDAAALCQAVGKRLCDANEWEGACAGTVEPMRYDQNRWTHNQRRPRIWAYGAERRGDLCGFGGQKSPGCDDALSVPGGRVWQICGSNTWPAGWFHRCVSPLGVYDLHGNAAEQMNLPLTPGQSTRQGGSGITELKGSWFAFSTDAAILVHPDDCRWRAPGWHQAPLLDPQGHANYHLGFRCCAD